MTQLWSLGHIVLDFKVSQISRSPLIEIKLKQGSVSKNLLTLEIGFYSLFKVSQDMEGVLNPYGICRIQDKGYRSQDTVTQ